VTPLPPGATIGILGGGQLGRMLAIAAAQLGFDVAIYTDEDDSPASRVAARTWVGDYRDQTKLRDFAQHVAIVTTEFENVPAETASALIDAGVVVSPNPNVLAVAQDRFDEKSYFQSAGIATPAFAAVASQADLDAALAEIRAPAILKTRRLGYDGRGQIRIGDADAAAGAYEKLGALGILEAFCGFTREVSVIAARDPGGAMAFYDLCENVHAHGILSRTTLPAKVSAATQEQAEAAARSVMQAFDYIGVLTIEFFLMPDGSLVANEMAPRVHNSGHWTIEGAATSQFEQHIRAIAGWPLGSTERLFDIEMDNLIGEEVLRWPELLTERGAHLHLYGKRDIRPGRKLGHLTRLAPRG
jgi:5-(carboxyamino)imidazole ribonucleotide synthase